MIKAIIIDDEQAATELVKTLIYSFTSKIKVVHTSTAIPDAIQAIQKFQPEIIFLDIELRDGLGFEILEHFPKIEAHVIFITAYDNYAIKAIKFHAFDYILKPIMPEELQSAIQKVLAQIEEKTPLADAKALLTYLKNNAQNRMAVPGKNGLYYYQVDDVVSIEGDGSYSIMHLTDKKEVVVTRKIKDFEESLGESGFIRVHKSFLINSSHITQLHRDDSGYLLMSNGQKIPISPKDKEEIIRKIKMVSTII